MADNVVLKLAATNAIDVQKDDVTVSSSATTLNFEDTGNSTVTVTNDGGGKATINIDSSAGTQNLWATINGNTGSTSANSPTDVLSILGGTNISTAVSGDTLTINNTYVFGTQFQQVQDETVSTTNGTTYLNKLTLTTPVIPAGTYRIGWTWRHTVASTSTSIQVRVQLDATDTLIEHQEELQDATNQISNGGFAHRTLTNAAHTITMDYRRQLGTAANVSIADTRLEIWRVA